VKHPVTRMGLLLAVLALVVVMAGGCGRGGGAGGGEGENYTISFSHVVTPNTPKGMGAERFKELVEQNSDGRMTVEVYPNSELYGDEDELQALTGNSVQMIAPASSKLSEIARQLLVLDLPFLFEDVNEVQEFTSRDSRSGQAIYENQDLSSNNMQVMGLWGNGFYQFTSNTAIRTPANMQGQRIRITPSDVIRSYIETWGAETTPMAFAEVFTGLQQGVVDGQYNPYSNIESQQFYTVQNYLTVSNHGYLIYPLVINREFFESLPDDLQQVVTEAADEASTYVGEIAEEDNQDARRIIEESGEIEFIELSAEERQAFKDEVVPSVWNEFSEDIGQDVIDELLARQEQQASR
jgi:C4-dicarboxylate-binding protein DctP